MRLARCSEQTTKTLESFYEEWAGRGAESGVDGRAMLQLFDVLRACADPREAWGLTSLATLYLLARDASSSPWYVHIFAPGHGGFEIDYLMPAAIAPWPEARVRGEARSVDDAVAMIRTAMDRSEGWAPAT
jgi:hypothetical protein